MLAEQAEAIHAHLVHVVHHIRHSFGDLLLQLRHDLEDVIVLEHFIQPQHNLSQDDEDIPLQIQRHLIDTGLPNADGLQAVDDDIDQDIVHALAVLHPRIRQSQQDLPQHLARVQILLFVGVCAMHIFVDLFDLFLEGGRLAQFLEHGQGEDCEQGVVLLLFGLFDLLAETLFDCARELVVAGAGLRAQQQPDLHPSELMGHCTGRWGCP